MFRVSNFWNFLLKERLCSSKGGGAPVPWHNETMASHASLPPPCKNPGYSYIIWSHIMQTLSVLQTERNIWSLRPLDGVFC